MLGVSIAMLSMACAALPSISSKRSSHRKCPGCGQGPLSGCLHEVPKRTLYQQLMVTVMVTLIWGELTQGIIPVSRVAPFNAAVDPLRSFLQRGEWRIPRHTNA